MTVVDVNTGKFTGSGGNLEETVTKNNLEAAEEIVRQLRLRDIGGIIVVDFIDMVLESNRDLVLRRLVECLGRDRTRHQVAEVTSLGLVQMTRKRIGTGLLESFSHDCAVCHGRGVVIEEAPVEPSSPRRRAARPPQPEPRQGARTRRAERAHRGPRHPSPKDVAAMARHEHAEAEQADGRRRRADDRRPAEASRDSRGRRAMHRGGRRTDARRRRRRRPTTAAEPTAETDADADPEAGSPRPQPSETHRRRAGRRSPSRRRPPSPRRRASSRAPAGARPAARPGRRPWSRRRAGGPAVPRTPPAAGALELPGDETPALHVPVKRKGGARKR